MKIEKPIRVKRTYTQHLVGTPQAVFPLLCPVREVEWVNDWDPNIVISNSGIAELGCIFTIGSSDSEAIWIVRTYDPSNWKIDFLKIIPNVTVTDIEIKLEESGNKTLAHISYMVTSIGPKGIKLVQDYTEEYYVHFMKAWEEEINYFLKTGKKLPIKDKTEP